MRHTAHAVMLLEAVMLLDRATARRRGHGAAPPIEESA